MHLHVAGTHKSLDICNNSYPIITPISLGKKLDINYRTARRYLAVLAKGKVLREEFLGKYHLYINKLLLELLKK
jgi:hypothetical protein